MYFVFVLWRIILNTAENKCTTEQESVEKAVSKAIKFRMELEKLDELFDEEACKRYSGWIIIGKRKRFRTQEHPNI